MFSDSRLVYVARCVSVIAVLATGSALLFDVTLPANPVRAGEQDAAAQEEAQFESPAPRKSENNSNEIETDVEASSDQPNTDEQVENETDGNRNQTLRRLDPTHEIWVDPKRRRVIVGGEICLRKGMLEMFACPDGTKNHESVVALKTKAQLVHAALLAIGVKAGKPVQYDPVYRGATGQKVKIEVIWRDKAGKLQRVPAQKMIRHFRKRTAMQHDWVFAGSGFWKDDETGKEYYQAEGGELICLSNFSTATLDLPIESSRDNQDLIYEAFTENIPPLGTKVRLILSGIEE